MCLYDENGAGVVEDFTADNRGDIAFLAPGDNVDPFLYPDPPAGVECLGGHGEVEQTRRRERRPGGDAFCFR
jgi:hypothetical protein